MMIYQLIALILLCFCLIYSTGLIVNSIKNLALKTRLKAFGLTALLAISTSLPELMVSIVAAIEGNTSLILGNIIGSNIANLSLVIGGAALIGGTLKVSGDILSRDIYLTGTAGFLPIFLIADGTLSRSDGIVLLVIYLVMISTFLRIHHQNLVTHAIHRSPIRRIFEVMTSIKGNGSSVLKLLLGLAILLTASHFIVQLSTSLALSTGLPTLFIGLFIVAVGTSLPELALEMKAIYNGEDKIALGNLLGSIVANSTLILGISALIRPLTLTHRGLIPYALAIGAFTVIYFLFFSFVRTKKKLEWWEGLILILGYVVFAWLEFARS